MEYKREAAICSECLISRMNEFRELVPSLEDCTGTFGIACVLCNKLVQGDDVQEHISSVLEKIDVEDTRRLDGCDNDYRVALAKRSLSLYEEMVTDTHAALTDMMTDIMHLCYLAGIETGSIPESARMHFIEEIKRKPIDLPTSAAKKIDEETEDVSVIQLKHTDEI